MSSFIKLIQALQAGALVEQICTNLRAASESVEHSDYMVVLRGDSTLRGHFPEVYRVASALSHYLAMSSLNLIVVT